MVLDRPVSEPDLAWYVPEPATFWIDASPRSVTSEEGLRLDPRTRDLAGVGRRPPLARARPPHGPATVYLASSKGERSPSVVDLTAWCRASETALLHHLEAADRLEGWGSALVDVLGPVLEADWESLAETPPESIVLWPLLAGIGDSEEALSEGLDAMATAVPRAVVGVIPELSRPSRRVLSERYGETLFDALFHPRSPRPRRFAAACHQRDLEFLPPRLIETGSRRLERAVAAELALVADLLMALGASPPEGQRFYRAARWVEATPHDLSDVVAHDNLGIVPAIDDEIERLIDELAGGRRRSTRLESLVNRWVDWCDDD